MKYLTFIFTLALLCSCTKENFEIDNLNGNRIEALGHAGMGFSSLYPINSAESILNAINIGADGTEIDIQLTKDNILVAFHDNNLGNSTNLEGLIRDYTWEEIKAAHYQSTPYLHYNIVRVSELMENINNREIHTFSFDIKLYPSAEDDITSYFDDYVNSISLLFSSYDLYSHCHTEVQNEDFIANLTIADSQISTFVYPQDFETGINIAIDNDLRGISIHTDNISKEQVKLAHENGLYVIIWGVNSNSDNKEAVLKNPDFIETDALKNLIDLLDN